MKLGVRLMMGWAAILLSSCGYVEKMQPAQSGLGKMAGLNDAQDNNRNDGASVSDTDGTLRLFTKQHTAVTEEAVKTANQWFAARDGEKWQFNVENIKRGNSATDCDMVEGAATVWDCLALKNYQHLTGLPSDYNPFHFMRDQGQSRKMACDKSKTAIINGAKQALNYLKSKSSPNVARFEFFVGHSSHIMQDSFSDGHLVRLKTLGEDSYKSISDIYEWCVGPIPGTGHNCNGVPHTENYNTLSKDAVQHVTYGLLLTMGKLAVSVKNGQLDPSSSAGIAAIDSKINNLFDGKIPDLAAAYQGYFNCSSLK